MKGRLFNFRLPFFSALSLTAGIAAVYAFAHFGWDFFYLLAVVPCTAAIFILLFILSCKKGTLLNCALLAAFFALGCIYASIIFNNLSIPPAVSGRVASVTGMVEDVLVTSSGRPYVILSSAAADGVPLAGKIAVYLSDEAGGALSPGYKVSLFGYVGHYDLFSYGSLNYRVINGITNYAEAYGSVEYVYGFSLFGSVRKAVYDVLYANLDGETAAVAYAMITGSTQDVSAQTLNAFRYGGVAHIFAVSGLNITVLYVSVLFLLRLFRMPKVPAAAISCAVIAFYTGLCGFTLSAVRAAVMCGVAAISSLARKKYDGLNSLSVAVIIILLVNPLNLFDVGFILSVSAMLGIIFLSHNLNNVLIKLPAKIRANITMSVASQISTLPALMLTFGYISGAGLILNIAVLPVLTFLYVFLFACVVLCLIVPPLSSVVLPVAALPLQAVVNFFVSGGFERSLISGFGGAWLPFVLLLFVAALSDKFNFSRSVRGVLALISVCAFALGCFLSGYMRGGRTQITAGGCYGGGMVLFRSQTATTLVISSQSYPGGSADFVSVCAPEGVDNLIILGDDDAVSYYYSCGVDAENVYLSPANINLGGADGANLYFEQNFESGGTYYAFNDSYTLTVHTEGVSVCISFGDRNGAEGCDLLITDGALCPANTVVYFGERGGEFSLYAKGRLQFAAEGGKLILEG